ncbi:MAG: hypothetical protein ACXV2C_01760 [Candidatus Bathyarchaeia archaeon]
MACMLVLYWEFIKLSTHNLPIRVVTESRIVALMNSFDFSFIVLPLGFIVFLLVAGIMLILKREEIAKDKKIRRIDAVFKEKSKQHELMEKQIRELDVMKSSKSIDSNTHKRLKTLIRMHEEKQEETEVVLRKIWTE